MRRASMDEQIERPRPRPSCWVVKNGWNRFPLTAAMPVTLSTTVLHGFGSRPGR